MKKKDVALNRKLLMWMCIYTYIKAARNHQRNNVSAAYTLRRTLDLSTFKQLYFLLTLIR